MGSMALALQNYTGDKINPVIDKKVVEMPVNLPPSSTFVKGQLIGPSGSSTNDVQTLTVTNTPTTGTAIISGVNPLTGAAFSFSLIPASTSAQAQTAIRAAFGTGSTGVAVTGGAWPGTPLVFTFSGPLASRPIPLMTTNVNDLNNSPVLTMAHTTQGVTGGTWNSYSATVAAVPTPPVLTGTGSGGTWPAGAHVVSITGVNAQGETTPSIPSGITLTSTQSIHIAAIAGLDTSFTALNVYIDGMFAGTCAISAGTSTATDFAEPANTGIGSADKAKPTSNTAYKIANGAGTQAPRAILPFACATDSLGKITLGTVSGGGEWGQTYDSVPAYFSGYFRAEDLVGLDASAISSGAFRQITGTTSSGIVELL